MGDIEEYAISLKSRLINRATGSKKELRPGKGLYWQVQPELRRDVSKWTVKDGIQKILDRYDGSSPGLELSSDDASIVKAIKALLGSDFADVKIGNAKYQLNVRDIEINSNGVSSAGDNLCKYVVYNSDTRANDLRIQLNIFEEGGLELALG